MAYLNYADLKVGDRVGVVTHRGFNSTTGYVGVVTKANKLRVHVAQETALAAPERVFSVKKRNELNVSYSRAFLEFITDFEAIRAAQRKQIETNNTWFKVEAAARSKNLAELKALVAELEAA